MWGDRAPFCFADLVSCKDSINPTSGHTHSPGKTYPPLEQLIPPLGKEYEKITCQIMWLVHQKAQLNHRSQVEAKAAAAAGSSVSTATPHAKHTQLPSTITQGKTSEAKGSRKMKKQQKRQKMEKLCNGYKLLEGDQGLVIEDERGVPLLIVVRNVLPQNQNVGIFDTSLHFC